MHQTYLKPFLLLRSFLWQVHMSRKKRNKEHSKKSSRRLEKKSSYRLRRVQKNFQLSRCRSAIIRMPQSFNRSKIWPYIILRRTKWISPSLRQSLNKHRRLKL